MKRLLGLLLSAIMLFSLVGCTTAKTEQAVSDVVSAITDNSPDSSVSEVNSDTQDSTVSSDSAVSQDIAQTNDAPHDIASPETAEQASPSPEQQQPTAEAEPILDPDGTYTSKDDVALYIHLYGCLPQNFITKKQAQSLGWEGGSLEPFAPGKCIGGSYFGNYEGLLPEKDGREYTECDIDTLGAKSRGAKRIVFSNDGLIYYTDDHYESFTLLYGEE